MGHFTIDCTQDINLTKAIGKLHHTLEAETPIAKSLLTEFFIKLMRVQRKHDIVQAKLKKARQTGTGGTQGGTQGGTSGRGVQLGNPQLTPTKTPGVPGPQKGARRVQPRRAVRFQNPNPKDKPSGAPRKGGNVLAAPVVPRKDTVSEVLDEEDTQDTDYDTEDLADLPTDSDSDDAPDDSVGLDPSSDGDSQ